MNDILGVALGALAGLLASILTNRRERATAADRNQIDRGALELDVRRLDGEEVERAQRISRQTIETLEREITRLDAIIRDLRADLAASEQAREDLEAHVRDLEDSAATMRRLLEDAGIALPPGVSLVKREREI